MCLFRRQKEVVMEKCGQLWKMCQIFKFKQSNKLKMTYIQQFLEENLIQFYLSSLRKHLEDPSFLDFNQQPNVFTLTAELLLFAQRGCGNKWKEVLRNIITKEMLISYECLRNYRLPVCESDGELMRLMKSKIKEVHIQLLQLLLRITLCYIEAAHSQCLNNTTLNYISEIALIYPQVKAEISISFPSISLSNFMEHFIMVITQNGMNSLFSEILNKIKEECAIMGNLQRVIDRIVDEFKAETDANSKKLDKSSIDSDNQEDRLNESNGNFNDFLLLRRKKRKVIKEFVRAKSDAQNRTPIKETVVVTRYTPKTQKTQENNKPTQTKSPHKRTPIFKKIKKTLKKPLERTIYYGQTKKFVPKKPLDPEYCLQKMLTSSSLLNEPANTLSYVDTGRKTEKKPSKFQMNDLQVGGFCIPQTPRPNMEKKNSLVKKTQPMDFFKINTYGLKN